MKDDAALNTIKKYRCTISLGFFCSVAIDSKELGYRSFSSPFDWIISDDFEKTVIQGINNRFRSFIKKKDFNRHEETNHYYNKRYHYWIYHDFNNEIPMIYQFLFVKRKYKRRCKKLLYEFKKGKVLFIRYCSSQKEIDYIKNNIVLINNLFTKNGSNIIFICNDNLIAPINFYKVHMDDNDSVNRHPLFANIFLSNYLSLNVVKNDKKISKYKKIKKTAYGYYIRMLLRIKKFRK